MVIISTKKICDIRPVYLGASSWVLAFAIREQGIEAGNFCSIGPFFDQSDCADMQNIIEKTPNIYLRIKYADGAKINWKDRLDWSLVKVRNYKPKNTADIHKMRSYKILQTKK